ncbi:MAG TPA: zf-HC2 domain-containing protein [Nocardioidaceae bacterium]|nr:zf-HC2 domain-containing protein [Nocardioidaceae bacterium]
MSRHLGDHMAALVDGELDHASRDRALAHLTHCGECRLAVQQERWIKGRLQALPVGEPSASLLGSLFATARATAGEAVTAAPAFRVAAPVLGRGRRAGLALAGAGSVSAAMFGVAYLLGGSSPPSDPIVPTASPIVGEFSAQFASTAEGLPFSDPSQGVVPAGVAGPATPVASR